MPDTPNLDDALFPAIERDRLFGGTASAHPPRILILYDRIVDVMEELVKFTLLTRDRAEYLVDRYSERKESAEAMMKRVNLSAAT